MARNRFEVKNTQSSARQLADVGASLAARQNQVPAPESLHHVFDESAERLAPGDVIVLDDSQSLRSQVESGFFAVLACPRCGTLNLITASHYLGSVPVICGSNTCSCSFRIEDECGIVYMPVN